MNFDDPAPVVPVTVCVPGVPPEPAAAIVAETTLVVATKTLELAVPVPPVKTIVSVGTYPVPAAAATRDPSDCVVPPPASTNVLPTSLATKAPDADENAAVPVVIAPS